MRPCREERPSPAGRPGDGRPRFQRLSPCAVATVAVILAALACGEDRPVAPADDSPLVFEEVGRELGIDYAGPTSGLAVGDFDGDGWEDLYSANHGSPPRLFRNVGGRFEDATHRLAGSERGDAHGAAWADFDNDGDQDLLLLVGAQRGEGRGENRLYVNRAGRLDPAPGALGLADPLGRGRTPLWLDWNLDGRLDALLNNAPRPGVPSRLLLGGETGFAPVGREPWEPFSSQLAGPLVVGEAAALLVAGGDGQLFALATPDGTGAAGARFRPLPTASDWAHEDFDGDGLGDLLVLRGSGGPGLRVDGGYRVTANLPVVGEERGISFASDGPVRFVLEPASPRWWQPRDVRIGSTGVHPPGMDFTLTTDRVEGLPAGPGDGEKWIALGRTPETGRWTLRVGAREREVLNVVVESASPIDDVRALGFDPERGGGGRAQLFRGARLRVDETPVGPPPAELDGIDVCGSLAAADLDNDGDVDLYFACGESGAARPNRLLLNDGGGAFEDVPGAGGATGSEAGTPEGLVVIDVDLDGRLDLVVGNGAGLRPFNAGPLEVFRNRGPRAETASPRRPGADWLQIALHGRTGTADGLGARLELSTDRGRQIRLRGGEIHAGGQNRPIVHFGLGDAAPRSLEVRWPDGGRQRLVDPPANRTLHVIESGTGPATEGGRRAAAGQSR